MKSIAPLLVLSLSLFLMIHKLFHHNIFGGDVRKHVFFILTIFVASALLHCDKGTKVEYVSWVQGTVVDSLTKAPIDSAWVDGNDTLLPHWSYTDTLGYYVAFAGAPGRYRFLYCGKSGYTIKKKEYATFRDDTTTVDFELVPTTP